MTDQNQWPAWGDEPAPAPTPRDGTISLLWMKLRRLVGTRPTAIDDHEGQIRYERDGDVDGKAYLARYLAGGTYEWKELTAAGGGTLTIQSNDADVDTAVTTIDFSTQFTVTSSPSGEANISLAATGTTIEVQEGGVKEDDMTVLNFDGTDFNVTNSPAGTANISLAYGTVAGTPAEGDHTHSYLTHPQVISRIWLVG